MNEKLIGAGIELGMDVLGIAAKAIAGAFAKPEEIRQAYLDATDKFIGFIAVGGEMDQRRDAARSKTDAAIAKAEQGSGQRPDAGK